MYEILITFSDASVPTHIACLSRTINVVRSKQHNLLLELAQGIFSQTTAVQILSDGKVITLQQQQLFGYQEKTLEPSQTVAQFFQDKVGIGIQKVGSLLKEHGLASCENFLLSQVGEERLQLLRLLAFLYKQKLHGDPRVLLVLHDPFKNLGSELREHAAMFLLALVNEKRNTILITYLSERAESWIGNKQVHRIEVHSEVEQTVGIHSSQMSQFIARSQAVQEKAQTSFQLRQRAPVILAVFLVGIFLVYASTLLTNPVDPIIEARQTPDFQNRTTAELQSRGMPPSGANLAVGVPVEAKDFGTHEKRLLASFPEEIEESLKAAFRYQNLLSVSEEKTVQEQEQKTNQSLKSMFAELAEMPSKQDPITAPYQEAMPESLEPVGQIQQEGVDTDWEQRREEMRRKFLEAISQDTQ